MFLEKVFGTVKTSRLFLRDFMFSVFLRIVVIVKKVTWKTTAK